MTTDASTWAIVLAAGDGSRLAPLTTAPDGTVVPKQFFRFGGGASLLETTLRRARGVAPPERVLAVVSEGHRRFWEEGLPGLPARNVIVQSRNRGTAPGILLPLLHLYYRDPDAVVSVLPSDHHVAREEVLRDSFEAAGRAVREDAERLVLLGMTPTAPLPDYGWILASPGPAGRPRAVAAFVEKPDRERALRLMRRGGLWSSFLMVGHVRAFLALYARHLPGVLRRLLVSLSPGGLEPPPRDLREAYEALPSSDFSRDVLEVGIERLSVLAVPSCGWSDLGTPERVAEWQPAVVTHAR